MQIKDVIQVTQDGLNSLIAENYFPIDHDADPASYTLTEQDSALLVDMGKAAVNSTRAADLVFNTMIDVIGKMIIDTRAYNPSLPKLFVDPIEWGGFVEHVHVGLSDIMVDEMWDTAYRSGVYGNFIDYSRSETISGTVTPIGKEYARHLAEIEHGVYKPKAYSKIYEEAKPVMVALTTAREQLFTAFKSWDKMNSFLSALYTSVQNTLNLKAEVYALMCISTGIARAFALGNYVDLRTAYNTEHGFTSSDAGYLATAAECRNSDAFSAFALAKMADTMDNAKRFTGSYNNHVEPTFTPESDKRLILLARYANILKFGVRANTYHEELLGIGDYDKVTAWQAVASSSQFDWEGVSTISLTKESAGKTGLTDGTTSATLSNVIGFFYDKYSLGITLDKKNTTMNYIASTDSWNTYHHSLINYICNDDYNMIVFTLGEDDE